MIKDKKTFALIALGIILSFCFFSFLNKTEHNEEKPELYDRAINYLKTHHQDVDQDKEDYQYILSYQGLKTSHDDQYEYAYMWILAESYYVEDQKLCEGSGSSMAYRWTFKDGRVIQYMNPQDGSDYLLSMKALFPQDVLSMMDDIDISLLAQKNKQKVRQHYAYLNMNKNK